MAETIVKLVLGKLGDAVVQEALFLYGVRDKVERVQRDLTWIQSFLKDADTKRHKNERVKIWVNEVQEVGYLIEDSLDKFLVEVGGGRPEGFCNVLKRIGKMPMKLISKHKIGTEIDQIQKRLSEIKENKILYGIEGLEQTSSGSSLEQPTRLFVNPDIDEMEVVGFEDERKAIVDQLIDKNNQRRAMISIVGAGGSGKTTLAKEVYKSAEVKRHFDISLWLCERQGELPLSFWGNKHLRHIDFSICRVCCATPEGSPSEADLQSLLMLKRVRARQDWVAKLPNFPNIRKLGIVIPKDVAEQPLINLLSTLNHLGSLYLAKSWGNPMAFSDCISTFRKNNHLHSFSLAWGKWCRKEVGDCTMLAPHLVKLTLGERTLVPLPDYWFSFEEDPMPQLEKLPNLRILKLYNSSMEAADGKHMVCSTGGFGRLQGLILDVRQLKEWTIEEGAMPMLNQLELECQELEIVPDLQYLVNLQELNVVTLNQVNSRLKGEDQWKIKHIPSVRIG